MTMKNNRPQQSLTVKNGVIIVTSGGKMATHVPFGMKGKTLQNLISKNKQSFEIARQVLTHINP